MLTRLFSHVSTLILMLSCIQAFGFNGQSNFGLKHKYSTAIEHNHKSVCRGMRTVAHAVVEIGSPEEFDKAVNEAAGDSLVVIDYSTTWCGPCKIIYPKYEELSEKYTEAVFLKVIGDSSQDASALMKREGVRSVPAFHFFKNGKRLDTVNGADEYAIETAIKDGL